MNSTYTPDDKPIQPDAARAIIKAARARLKDGGEGRAITSRDTDINDALLEGARTGMPDGLKQWQLPFEITGPAFFYITSVDPGAIVGKHSHKRNLFRLVVSGSIILDDGRELKTGDWMYVPAGVEYSFRGAHNPGAVICHCYG
jgi:mannose-6-phosphate isomerase-like protein (cupin superfamily)